MTSDWAFALIVALALVINIFFVKAIAENLLNDSSKKMWETQLVNERGKEARCTMEWKRKRAMIGGWKQKYHKTVAKLVKKGGKGENSFAKKSVR